MISCVVKKWTHVVLVLHRQKGDEGAKLQTSDPWKDSDLIVNTVMKIRISFKAVIFLPS